MEIVYENIPKHFSVGKVWAKTNQDEDYIPVPEYEVPVRSMRKRGRANAVSQYTIPSETYEEERETKSRRYFFKCVGGETHRFVKIFIKYI